MILRRFKKSILAMILATVSINGVAQAVAPAPILNGDPLDANVVMDWLDYQSSKTSVESARIDALETASPTAQAHVSTLVITNNDYLTIEIPADITHIKINGTITLLSDFSRFSNLKNITYIGGKIVGNGGLPGTSFEFSVGNSSTFKGTSFDNIIIDGSFHISIEQSPLITNGFALNFHETNVIRDSLIANATVYWFGHISYSNISNSTILRGRTISHSDISSSTIGTVSSETNDFNNVDSIINNFYIRATLIYLDGSNQSITNNTNINDSYLRIKAGGFSTVSNNHFNDPYVGKNEIISIDTSEAGMRSVAVSNNNFIVQSSTPQTITITGSSTTSISFTSIQNNNFLKGGAAISYTGTNNVVVSANNVKQTNLGVSDNNSTLRVQNNIDLD